MKKITYKGQSKVIKRLCELTSYLIDCCQTVQTQISIFETFTQADKRVCYLVNSSGEKILDSNGNPIITVDLGRS